LEDQLADMVEEPWARPSVQQQVSLEDAVPTPVEEDILLPVLCP
jgi:hypothetical protein